ncbi:MAG: hypothetical protein GC152_10510 [Alphaproteobacteria bacterium]|nr:hypothetical protein [Alphaproteobacteria bacterium]
MAVRWDAAPHRTGEKRGVRSLRLLRKRFVSFLKVDPFGTQDQMKLYAYVWNDPVSMAWSAPQLALAGW